MRQRQEGWSPRQLASCRQRLEGFAEDVFSSVARCDQRSRGLGYVRGLLLAGKRKSCEPMAARLGDVHPQALHHFLQASPWDWGPVRRRLAELACQALDPQAWIIDDTSFPKDGDWSVGVASVLGHAGQDRQLPDRRIGLGRRRAWLLPGRLAAVPAPVLGRRPPAAPGRAPPPQQRHRPKWQLALALLDELAGWGMPPLPITSDAGYGEVPAFRLGLETRGLVYVVGCRRPPAPTRRTPIPACLPGRGGAADRGADATRTGPKASASWSWSPARARAWT